MHTNIPGAGYDRQYSRLACVLGRHEISHAGIHMMLYLLYVYYHTLK